ncbi:unnamed protein product [Heligmosomoides polygyrus]|uniref:PE domain-containing protein n=1 Tax=Heligmosomoides polygyrus TaxID=6339 RepID=A0A183FN31_HELPZ|nr:unnamed protein product [Heligmosomoides polygyrus]
MISAARECVGVPQSFVQHVSRYACSASESSLSHGRLSAGGAHVHLRALCCFRGREITGSSVRGASALLVSAKMANDQMEITSPELERLLLDEPTAEEQLSSMRATLAEIANAVKTLAQQNVSQVTPGVDLAHVVTKQVDIQQMNAHEFANVEYHASFDPIAAAQGGIFVMT